MGLRVVVDALPARGLSLAIVMEHLLAGWQQLGVDDELHVLLGEGNHLPLPGSVTTHRVPMGRRRAAGRIAAQWRAVPRLCREVGADVMLGCVPASTVAPLPCPRVVIAYDLRYRLRPQQFERRTRWLKVAGHAVGYRLADGVCCISERTRSDLLAAHPYLATRRVSATPLGADHVDRWPTPTGTDPYALAFGQFGNKRADLVLQAWALLAREGEAMPLVMTGIPDADRAALADQVRRLGLGAVVTLLPWLPADELHRCFAGASLVVFPSDFEGFGLPAVEAMRLGIPVVVSRDPALAEVTGGHATVAAGPTPADLVRAVGVARRRSPAALAEARAHTDRYTWCATASAVRDVLEGAVEDAGGRRTPVRPG